MESWNGEERRTNRLHADDIQAIIAGISAEVNTHYCRFSTIKTEDMEAVIPFMLSFKSVTEKTGMLVWKLVISCIVIAVGTWTAIGFWFKMKGKG